MKREVAVPAGRTTAAWLYGVPRGPSPEAGWPVVATDGQGAVVATASARVDPARRLGPGEELILQMSSADLGLGDYARQAASHAERRLMRGLTLSDLPDRVQGLASVSAIVWAPDAGGNPSAADVPAAALSAWVRRGGHLVVVLPSVGERWTQSPLAPLLPLPRGETPRRSTVRLPALGVTRPVFGNAAEAMVLPERGGAVLLRALDGEPLVVTARRGFGAVTLVGIDLSAPAYREEPLPSGMRRLWNDVFGWSDPAVSERREATLRGELAGRPPEIKPARELPPVEVGAFLSRTLGLTSSVSFTLTVLLVLLVLLPIVAGGAWAWSWRRTVGASLAGKGQGRAGAESVLWSPLRFAWPVFAGICVVAAMGSALIALAGRPEGPSARHQSVVDILAADGMRRTHARVSLFVPGFGRAAVSVAEEAGASVLLSTEGMPASGLGTRFLDPQSYALDAAEPAGADLPLRSTTRSLRLDVLEPAVAPAARGVRLIGVASHRAGTGQLNLKVESSLPVDLRDVLLVYCPGEAFGASGREPLPPLAWRFPGVAGGAAGVWPAGATLEIDRVPSAAAFLAALPPLGEQARGFRGAGWLNAVLDQSGLGAAAAPRPDAAVTDPVRAWELLSFFGRLPMPDVATVVPPFGGRLFRSLPDLIQLDRSALTSGPRVFVLGHADGDALPLPLRVDGVSPPSTGRTLYRVLIDLADAS